MYLSLFFNFDLAYLTGLGCWMIFLASPLLLENLTFWSEKSRLRINFWKTAVRACRGLKKFTSCWLAKRYKVDRLGNTCNFILLLQYCWMNQVSPGYLRVHRMSEWKMKKLKLHSAVLKLICGEPTVGVVHDYSVEKKGYWDFSKIYAKKGISIWFGEFNWAIFEVDKLYILWHRWGGNQVFVFFLDRVVLMPKRDWNPPEHQKTAE